MKKNPYPGRFIVFDGLDGSGLSTQSELLFSYLKGRDKEVVLTKEPTNSLVGGLVNAHLEGNWQSSDVCLQLLFSADRAFHLDKEIEPLLKKGVHVICDRYAFSTVAFGGLSLDKDWLLEIQRHFLAPDISFLLKVEPAECIRRIRERSFHSTLFEKKDVLRKAWENYEKSSNIIDNVHIIDGERGMDKIHEEIKIITEETLWP